MSSPLVFALPGQTSFAENLCEHLDTDLADVTMRRFPDGETYVRVEQSSEDTGCEDRQAVVVCSLDDPDLKILPLFFLADTLRDLGVTRVGLVAPYLAYMRQDARFRPGEGITSRYFAGMAERHFDWLVTVDPHLHRYDSLSEIYSIDTTVVHAAEPAAAWIAANVERPLLIGPDVESEQWVAEVARHADAPAIVLEKVRRGDREVEISVPNVDSWLEHTPVLFDDIISTGHTMIETIRHLRTTAMKPPVVAGVHGLFADDAHSTLLDAGAARVVTTNTVAHASNAVDVCGPVANAVRRILSGG
jgi:ribose-phosphate pyrophosphokinase